MESMKRIKWPANSVGFRQGTQEPPVAKFHKPEYIELYYPMGQLQTLNTTIFKQRALSEKKHVDDPDDF